MYLEKLEVQGFKSFAKKNELIFPGYLDKNKRGITSVVGPNGSGKSNVADAVRWALGEQSMKTLRGKKNQDVIFSGSDKKGSLGMAEVSLFLNNENPPAGEAGKKAAIDYSQIVITRRLYRNGDSEYMINNNRVRLSDIQMLLAKAKFGQKTYSVIGQGMVEGFLNTTLAERKEFFDEATGVKQYQIKRDESLSKLRSSYENLIQAQMLLTEIEPRLKSLTRQVNRLQKRDELEQELKGLQKKYYRYLWHENKDKFNKYNQSYLELEKDKFAKDKKLSSLSRELEELEKQSINNSGFSNLQEELNQAQSKKDEIAGRLHKLEAKLEMKLEASGKFDLSFLINKKEEIEREIEQIDEEIGNQKQKIKTYQEYNNELIEKRAHIDKELENFNNKLSKLRQEPQIEESKELAQELEEVIEELKKLEPETDLVKIKTALKKAEEKIRLIIKQNGKATQEEIRQKQDEWQEVHEKTKFLGVQKEDLINKINDNKLRISAREERVKLLEEKIRSQKQEAAEIGGKIKQNSGGIDTTEITKAHTEYKKELNMQLEVIKEIKEKLHRYNIEEERKRSKLFALQRELQNLQNEINIISHNLNEIKISSTRYETKLEDLEIEIREELGSIKEIKEKAVRDLDLSEIKEKITQLKRQLELIGGIDPQVEEEYRETKERFDFLSGQVNDFTNAVSSLEKIIKELDVVIKDQFDKEFKEIAGNFEKYFKVLFNGGKAKIVKVMEEEKKQQESEDGESENTEKKDKTEMHLADLKKIKFLQKHNATGLAGIEIQATPPGKKIKTITMLSGGERALTAIALICAIISSNPSPFVVLDEVDAALDEANSERLSKILDELSHKTQFIVITHNRATMRRANILYGVTMGDDGVSKLLSIKLDEAVSHVKS